jgi:uncharacterized protein (TIGR02266 family)
MTQPLSAHRNESEEPGPVSLRFRFDSETVEQFAERYATDVSRGGIFVQSRQPFAVGTQLRLDLQLLNGTPLITGEGTVHWTREPDPAKPNTVPGMGIRFNKLSTRSQQVIEMVLSQRTGKQRTGLFSAVMPAVSLEESQKILNAPTGNSNPKSKLPFNVFPGRPHDPSKPSDDRELLANAGREEATPVVEATAAHLANARPGKDESSVRTPPPAVPLAEVGSGPASASGKRPPLSLIRPEAGAAGKEAEKAITESARVRRSSSSSKAAPLPPPPVTTTQEISPSGSTPPAPVQGEPALGASQSGVPMAIDAMPSLGAAAPSARPSNRNKLIMGAAALLAVSLTVFAVTRSSGSKLDAAAPVAQATPTSTAPAQAAEPTAPIAALPSATGTAPTETAPEANSGPATEPEAPSAPSTSGSSKSSGSRVADRRAPKGKTVVAHRESQPASRGSSPVPAEKPVVAEAPAPHVEAPAPTLAPLPPPPPVAHVEPPPAPKPVHVEPAPAPKPAPVVALPASKPAGAPATSPPPVAGLSHKLRMTSIPSEAEVEIDGKSVGRTPLFGVEVDVSQPHQLVVKKDGFAPFKQTISRGSEWNVRPSENTATLRISALMKKQ